MNRSLAMQGSLLALVALVVGACTKSETPPAKPAATAAAAAAATPMAPAAAPAGQAEAPAEELYVDLEGDPDKMPPFDDRGVEVVATAGGITNGMIGAWGPVVTPFLMGRQLAPRFAVGSVNTAEVAVAAVSVTSLVAAVG